MTYCEGLKSYDPTIVKVGWVVDAPIDLAKPIDRRAYCLSTTNMELHKVLLERQDDNKNLSKEIFQSYTLERDWDYFEKNVGMEREAKIDFLETMMSRYFDAVDKYQKESKNRKQGLIDNQLKEAGTNFTSYETVKCPACDHTHLFGENKEAYVQCEECEIDLVFTPSSLELLDPPFILEDFHEADRNKPASLWPSEQHHAEHYVESPQRVSQGSQILS